MRADLGHKAAVLTGPRPVGKTTLARALMKGHEPAQDLNWDVVGDRAIGSGAWRPF